MRRALSILLIFGAVTFLRGLGASAIQDADEAFYAEAGREMLGSGDWVVPHYNFEERLQKPIFYYWLVAGTYAVTGVNEYAARVWSGLGGLGLMLIAFGVGRRWFDDETGVLAGVMVATSFGFVPMARQALPDVPLAFFVSLTIWAAIEAAAAPRANTRWLYLSAAAAGFGMLTKGPLAVALPIAVMLPLFFWERRSADGARFAASIKFLHLVIATAIFVAVALPWFATITARLGPGYLWRFFFEENLERFGTSRYNERRPIYFYFSVIFGGLLPWSVFTVLWLRPIKRWLARAQAATPEQRRLLCWALAPLALLIVSVGSQPRYILPCAVPIAVLLARSIRVRLLDGGRAMTAAAMAGGAAMAMIGALVWRLSPLLLAANPSWSHLGVAAMIAAGIAAMLAAVVMRRGQAIAAFAVCALVTIVALESSVRAIGRPEAVEVIAAAARQAGPAPAICACGAFARNLTFYTHTRTVVRASEDEVVEFLSTGERVLAAIDSKMLTAVEARMGRTFPRYQEVTYFDLAALRLDSLLSPDAARLQRVILISNQ